MLHKKTVAVALAVLAQMVLAVAAHGALADDLAEATRLHRSGQTASALDRVDRSLAANPKEAQMRFLKSVILAESGRGDESLALLQQLVQEYPELAEPHNNLAALYAANGDYGKARLELEEALRINPGYAPAHENLGDVLALLAAQSYARAQRLEPASPSLSKKLALVRQIVAPGVVPRKPATTVGAASAPPLSR